MASNCARTTGRSNRWFTAAAVFGGVLVGAHFADALRPPNAQAQEPLSPFNSGEQRRQMIEQLREMNSRMGRLESQLKSGISVKVTEMPATKDAAKP